MRRFSVNSNGTLHCNRCGSDWETAFCPKPGCDKGQTPPKDPQLIREGLVELVKEQTVPSSVGGPTAKLVKRPRPTFKGRPLPKNPVFDSVAGTGRIVGSHGNVHIALFPGGKTLAFRRNIRKACPIVLSSRYDELQLETKVGRKPLAQGRKRKVKKNKRNQGLTSTAILSVREANRDEKEPCPVFAAIWRETEPTTKEGWAAVHRRHSYRTGKLSIPEFRRWEVFMNLRPDAEATCLCGSPSALACWESVYRGELLGESRQARPTEDTDRERHNQGVIGKVVRRVTAATGREDYYEDLLQELKLIVHQAGAKKVQENILTKRALDHLPRGLTMARNEKRGK